MMDSTTIIENNIVLDGTSVNGNPALKPCYTNIEMSIEQVEAYVRCSEDPIFFIENYVQIVTLDHGIQPFKMWDFQKNFTRGIIDNRFVIAKWSRQCGKTTTAAATILWMILFNSEFQCALLSNKMDGAQEVMDRIQGMYELLPKWMQQGVVTWNRRRIKLENGSIVFTAATSSSAIRGKSISCIYLDEFAHIDRNLQQKFYTSTYPAISSGATSKIIVTSTPNGFDMFAKLWTDASKLEGESGKNAFVPIGMHWTDVPGRDEAWRAETISNTSEEQFRQEFETDFIGSSDTLLSPTALGRLRYITPLRKNNNISVYKDPEKGHVYFITVDVAHGGGGDYSAFVVVDVTQFPYEVVATYRDNTITPTVYPNYIHHAAKMYNDAYVLVEINDAGQQVADLLYMELELENLLMVSQTGRKGQTLGGQGGVKPKFGVKTTNPVKRIGCGGLKSLMEHDTLTVNDINIVDEFFTFVFDGSNYSADGSVAHDDLVMCLVLFAWATTQQYFKDLLDSDVRARILNDIELAIENDMLPFGLFDNGMNDEDEVYTPSDNGSWFDQQLR